MTRDLVDPTDGENRAVRMFLARYGGGSAQTVPAMREHMTFAGFPYWPAWAEKDVGHLTKGGAQDWLRFLFAMETAPAPCAQCHGQGYYLSGDIGDPPIQCEACIEDQGPAEKAAPHQNPESVTCKYCRGGYYLRGKGFKVLRVECEVCGGAGRMVPWPVST